MKTVKSLADLQKSALSLGASVSVGGRKFNADGESTKVVAMPKPSARAIPEPAPEPAAPEPVAPAVNNISVDTQPIAQAQIQLGQLMASAMASMPQPVAPAREWEFTVARDSNGYIKTITAKAKE